MKDKPDARQWMTAAKLLDAVPRRNEAAQVEPTAGGALVTVPLVRPRWLVPPVSWVVPFRGRRRVELDALGAEVLEACDGKRTVEEVIEAFAAAHQLTFREAQLAVTRFLWDLVSRGIVAVIGV